ncbi:MAG: hypothetical protein K8S55_04020, partial [Phycisphaerae bacterium]|nr:hypothetical protein [Phycisphaerae bacterium]
WIFDISPSANSKSGYKVRHEGTNAAWSVLRTRVREIIAGTKLKRLRVADISREKNRMSVEDLDVGGENACGPTETRKRFVRCRAEKGRTNNPLWMGTSLMFTQVRHRTYAKYLPA